MLCDPGESEGRAAPGWAAWERVRSKRQENQVGRPEIEQTGLLDLLDKPRPITPESLGRDFGLQHGGDRLDMWAWLNPDPHYRITLSSGYLVSEGDP